MAASGCDLQGSAELFIGMLKVLMRHRKKPVL
jgi:hypothetical protein